MTLLTHTAKPFIVFGENVQISSMSIVCQRHQLMEMRSFLIKLKREAEQGLIPQQKLIAIIFGTGVFCGMTSN